MKIARLSFAPMLLALVVAACQSPSTDQTTEVAQASVTGEVKDMTSDVMIKSAQEALTPESALNDLMAGNRRYMSNDLNTRDLPAQVSATATGQFPKAVILSCIDSRVPVEMVFDQGVGDVFVARVAGNVEDEDLLGSMEYGLGVAGSKLLVVLGHESCGAVKSAIDAVDVGSPNVNHLLAQIEPAIADTDGQRNAKDAGYVEHVVKNNVTQTIEDIRERSQIIRNLEANGTIKVVGAYYSLESGEVTLVE